MKPLVSRLRGCWSHAVTTIRLQAAYLRAMVDVVDAVGRAHDVDMPTVFIEPTDGSGGSARRPVRWGIRRDSVDVRLGMTMPVFVPE